MVGVRFTSPNTATNVGGTPPDPLVNPPGGSLPRENFGVGFNPNSDALFGDSGQLFREERNEDRPAVGQPAAQPVPPEENYFDTVDPDLDAIYGSGAPASSVQPVPEQSVRFRNEGQTRSASKGSFIGKEPIKKPLKESFNTTSAKIKTVGALRNAGAAQDELKSKLRGEIKNVAVDTGKKVAEDLLKSGTRQAAKTATKEGVEVGAKVATRAAITGAEAVADVATAGLGLIITVFVEIALRLGFDDAFDGVAALAQVPPDITKARKLLVQAGMKVIIGLSVILIAISCFTVVGIIPALPALIFLHIYWFLGFVFPGSGWFNGFLKWELLLLVLVDVFVFIVFAVAAAALLYYACNVSGLNTTVGQAAAAAASYVGVSDLAGQLGSICASFPK
jgi:hypothetical protein